MGEPLVVEIFIIGNEILIGDIQDTNTNWLCKEISGMGGHVSRATVLRDDLEVVAAEIRNALNRKPDIIITSGGLGPTADDLTLAAVAMGAGVRTQPNEVAIKMVRDRYDEFAAKGIMAQGGLNPAREKMAWLPEGAEPLDNPVGTAPGVLFQVEKSAIISLPGVPSELKGIFNTSLQPFLRGKLSGGLSLMRTITVRCNDESIMEPVLSKVVNRYPGVYIKSLARTLGETPELDISFTAVGTEQVSLEKLVGSALKDLADGLLSIGIEHWQKQ